MVRHVVHQAVQFGADRTSATGHLEQPTREALFDDLDPASIALDRELLTPLSQIDRLLNHRDKRAQKALFVGRYAVAQLVGTPQQMGIALSLGVAETLIGFAAVDDQKAVESGSENRLGDFMA